MSGQSGKTDKTINTYLMNQKIIKKEWTFFFLFFVAKTIEFYAQVHLLKVKPIEEYQLLCDILSLTLTLIKLYYLNKLYDLKQRYIWNYIEETISDTDLLSCCTI